MVGPDVIVAWLQNDYGQLGRPADAIAHALVDEGLARRVAYVEPAVPTRPDPSLEMVDDRGLHVYRLSGPAVPPEEYAAAVIRRSELHNPILLNCGVSDENWRFHSGFAPHCRTTALVTHDVLHLWPGAPQRAAEHGGRLRALLARGNDHVIGLSSGSIAGIPGATYVGHGCDAAWSNKAVDEMAAPPEYARIPSPRAIYYGALSVRVETKAMRALADSGVNVTLVGFAPAPDIAELIADHPRVHFLGPKIPQESPPYLLHADVAIVPHTDEPFTASMEPHKLYNYAAAGLRSVTFNCVCPPALEHVVHAASDVDDFVAATWRAIDLGPLSRSQVEHARTLTWGRVARSIIETVSS